MSHAAEIRDVSDTAIWVAYYRGKESDRSDAMFRDPLAKMLTAERGEQIDRSFKSISRYTEWSVLSRTVLIDEYIQRAIADGVDAVINLGAGLDTRPYRMELPPTLQWVEADFPHMVSFKNSALKQETPRCRLQRAGVDLTDPTARRGFLARVVPDAKRILVLTEGVIPYLTEAQVAELAMDLLSQPRFAFWLTEFFSPQVYVHLQRLSKTPQLANSPFRFFPLDWQGFFRTHGWDCKEIHYSSEVAQRFGRVLPLPWIVRMMLSLMGMEARKRVRTMTGFMLLTPSSH
jgi:methyltransferase (TIGR00027 family)